MILVVNAFLEAILKAAFFAFVAYLGIIAGKKFRDHRDLKKKK